MSSLLVVGSVAYDSVETSAGSVEEALGGSATYFSIAASYFTEVQLVAVVGEDFQEADRELLAGRAIDLAGLQTAAGRTFRWAGRYSADFNQAFTLDTQLNVFEHFRPEIPEAYRDTRFVFLANIDPDLQREVLAQMRAPAFVACDTMNFWITGKLDSLKRLIGQVQLLVINDQELFQLSSEPTVLAAARSVLAWGPEALVVKRGEHGAMLVFPDAAYLVPAFPLPRVMDTTGAGDTFAGGLMGYLARTGDTSREGLLTGMACGAVLASYNVESFSVERLAALSMEDIRARHEDLRRSCAIGPLML